MTGPTASQLRDELRRRLPGHPHLGPAPGTREVSASLAADPGWLREQVRLLGPSWGLDPAADGGARRTLGTVWWYSASTLLVTPSLAGLVATGWASSPALADLRLHVLRDGRIAGSHATRVLGDDPGALGAALRAALGQAIAAVAEVSGRAERALWAIATDAIGGALLWAGREIGAVSRATGLAGPLGEAAGEPLLVPRYIDVTSGDRAGRYVRRVSCCLVYRLPGGQLCTSCPRRHPDERAALLRRAVEQGY